jgi:NADPH:quinone reductase-like Zn-dependent oxidoreductase
MSNPANPSLRPMSTGSAAQIAETSRFLVHGRAAMVGAAEAALARTHGRHYDAAGATSARERLEALYDRLIEAVETRDLGGVVAYARLVARERYDAGYDLSEVQAAFNTLEEATWSRALAELKPEEVAGTLGLVTTILGAAKDALAREYVSLATSRHAPSLDLSRLFAGTVG